MKTLLFLFAFYTTQTFAQSSIEKSIKGDWSCCGKYDITTAKELTFSKKTSKEAHNECTKTPCAYSTSSFENNEKGKSFVYTTHDGCGNEISNSDEKITGWIWNISLDNKTLILFANNKQQYKFSIISITPTQLILKKIVTP